MRRSGSPEASAHRVGLLRPSLSLLLCLLVAGCATSSAVRLPKEALRHQVKTRDGWTLSLVEYKAEGETRGLPVLLCHGISANGRNMDLDAQHSLARWLAAHGHDAWTMSLRGTGDSDAADPEQGRNPGYTFDTMARFDLPAAIDYVRAQEHVPAIDYVGHSMGGMLLYAYLAEGGQGVAAGVTLGSPTRLNFGGRLDPLVLAFMQRFVSRDGALGTRFAAQTFGPLGAGWTDSPLATVLYNPLNVTPTVMRELLEVGVDDISGALLLQLSSLIRDGAFESADGKLDYRRDMANIHTPMLVVAGKGDRVASAMAVKDGYRALGGPKLWILLGVENGQQADYGHMDMVIGERAPTELWPRVLQFLERPPR